MRRVFVLNTLWSQDFFAVLGPGDNKNSFSILWQGKLYLQQKYKTDCPDVYKWIKLCTPKIKTPSFLEKHVVTFIAGVPQNLLDLCIGGICAQSPEDITNLV